MYDLVVIGGGSGGLTIGKYGAKLNARVAVIEAGRLGGDCTWSGCVPSKALIASARAAHRAKHTADFGLPSAGLHGPVDLGRIVDRIHDLQQHISQHNDDPHTLRTSGCDVIEGHARFVAPDAVEVNGRRIQARHFCIATGSRPTVPPIPGLDRVDYWTTHTIFQQRVLPPRLLVIGAGPVGLELGQAFARLGSHVTIAEALPRILAPAEPEVAALLLDCLRDEGLDIRTDTRVSQIQRSGPQVLATLRGAGAEETQPFDALLVATGREPHVHELGLEAAGVGYSPTGITVDKHLRTSNPGVFAIGDVAGRHAYTHTAAYEAGIVLRNALFPRDQAAAESVVPAATFTDPEVAHVGLGEQDARARFRNVHVWRHPFAATDRALLDGAPRGFVKLITRGRRDQLLGAHIVGPQAGELIHEFVIALRAGLTASDIAQAMHVYPTLSEAARYAALQPYEAWLQSPNVQRLRRLTRAAAQLKDKLRR